MFNLIINEHNELGVNKMKKILIIIIILLNITTVTAKKEIPKYKIIANSNNTEDIEEMYKIKNELLFKYKQWVKGVDDIYQVLADHEKDYNAKYYNGLYTIILGKGKGKTLEGKLQVSYCTTSKEIKKKSWLVSIFS